MVEAGCCSDSVTTSISRVGWALLSFVLGLCKRFTQSIQVVTRTKVKHRPCPSDCLSGGDDDWPAFIFRENGTWHFRRTACGIELVRRLTFVYCYRRFSKLRIDHFKIKSCVGVEHLGNFLQRTGASTSCLDFSPCLPTLACEHPVVPTPPRAFLPPSKKKSWSTFSSVQLLCPELRASIEICEAEVSNSWPWNSTICGVE